MLALTFAGADSFFGFAELTACLTVFFLTVAVTFFAEVLAFTTFFTEGCFDAAVLFFLAGRLFAGAFLTAVALVAGAFGLALLLATAGLAFALIEGFLAFLGDGIIEEYCWLGLKF